MVLDFINHYCILASSNQRTERDKNDRHTYNGRIHSDNGLGILAYTFWEYRLMNMNDEITYFTARTLNNGKSEDDTAIALSESFDIIDLRAYAVNFESIRDVVKLAVDISD